MLKKTLLRSLALSALFLVAGCTGDPHTGGIFWSEDKAQDRLHERRARLDNVESDTDRVSSRNRQLEGAAARRQEMLGQ